MKAYILPMVLGVLLYSSIGFAAAPLGQPITLTQITKVSAILETPDQYVGKRVLIEGLIVNVCSMRGCWMDIAGDKAFEKIQVKVKDGVIVFPVTARGKTARVEGVVEKLELSYQSALRHAQHDAEKKGELFDPSKLKKEDQVIYRIRALGAEIE